MSLRHWGVGICGLLLVAAGCGAKGGGDTTNVGVTTPLANDGAVPTTTVGRYQPLSVGASWVYQVTDTNNVAYTKTSTVTAFEDVGGAFAGHDDLQDQRDGQVQHPVHLVPGDGHGRAPPA